MMNKRITKIVEKLQTGNKTIITVRRDQAIKAIQEGAFDYMTGHDHDEMSSWQLKQINNPTITDIESYFLEDTKVYATIENNILEVKFVTSWYSSRSLYINLNKESEPQQENTVEVIETSPEVAEVKTAKETKQDIKAEFKNLYNGMFSPEERRFILQTFKNIHNININLSGKGIEEFYNNHFAAYSEFIKHAIEVYNMCGTLTTELLTNPLPVEETQEDFTTEEITETNKIIDSITEMGWTLKTVFIDSKDMCIYGKVINSKGIEVIEGLYAPSYDKHELNGVLRCLQSKIVNIIEALQEEQQENNIISLDNYRSKKAAKQEIKQPKKNNKIVLCVCGSIIHEDEYKEIGICPNCINYVMEKFDDGTLKTQDPELYNMIAEGLRN